MPSDTKDAAGATLDGEQQQPYDELFLLELVVLHALGRGERAASMASVCVG